MHVNKAKKVLKFLNNMPPPILKLPELRQFLIFFDNSFSVDLHFTNNLRCPGLFHCGRLTKDGTDMGNGLESSKRETFREKKE